MKKGVHIFSGKLFLNGFIQPLRSETFTFTVFQQVMVLPSPNGSSVIFKSTTLYFVNYQRTSTTSPAKPTVVEGTFFRGP
jgi:hypothetical protein